MSFSVRVPASSANLGPGFDILAIAVGLYLEVDAEPAEGAPVVLEGPDLRGGGDLVLDGLRRVASAVGRPCPGCRLRVRSDIPVARGLGSSAAALVAGMLVGNRLLGDPLDRAALLRLACEAEGHGDNVAAALYGGVALAVPTATGWLYRPLTLARPLRAVVFVPEQRRSRGRRARWCPSLCLALMRLPTPRAARCWSWRWWRGASSTLPRRWTTACTNRTVRGSSPTFRTSSRLPVRQGPTARASAAPDRPCWPWPSRLPPRRCGSLSRTPPPNTEWPGPRSTSQSRQTGHEC